jgi:hypothetical protein
MPGLPISRCSGLLIWDAGTTHWGKVGDWRGVVE